MNVGSRRSESAAGRRPPVKRDVRRTRELGEPPRRRRREQSLARARQAREASLLDLIDRLLDGGVVIHGDITLAVADVDLVYVGLRAIVASVESVQPQLGSSLEARPG